MENIEATAYSLMCVATGDEFADTGWTLEYRECDEPSLVRAVYKCKKLGVKEDDYGLYKFCDWLPVNRMLKGSAAPVTYRSKGLGERLGLRNLYITLNGYCPERGADMTTCSFKETEAYSVCGRAKSDEERILVVASAGNTARAFAKVCSENNIRLLLSVPADNLSAMWFEKPLDPCVKLIACEKGGDYFDAIRLGDMLLKSPKFYAEGGAKNVARRDGMATTVLSAVTTIGRIPDYYFQAVGSGTGAIAAWEANMRLIEDGSYGDNTMRLMVSQNAPFVPMYDAWRADSRALLPYDADKARRDASIIDAKVLSNRSVRRFESHERKYSGGYERSGAQGGANLRGDGGRRHPSRRRRGYCVAHQGGRGGTHRSRRHRDVEYHGCGREAFQGRPRGVRA